MSGEEMDSRSNDSPFVLCIASMMINNSSGASAHNNCTTGAAVSGSGLTIGTSAGTNIRSMNGNNLSNISIPDSWKTRLSSKVYAQVLTQCGAYLSDLLITELTSPSQAHTNNSNSNNVWKFNEWGAMLFHEEINAIIKIFENSSVDIVNETNNNNNSNSNSNSNNPNSNTNVNNSSSSSLRLTFAKLIWISKILSLDQPIDIKRYNLPSSYLSDEETRNVLRKRVDFSTEAIDKIRLTFV